MSSPAERARVFEARDPDQKRTPCGEAAPGNAGIGGCAGRSAAPPRCAAGGDVDRGVLPYRPLRALKPAHEQAVHLPDLPGRARVDVPLRRRRRRRSLQRVAVAGDQRRRLPRGLSTRRLSTRQTLCSEIRIAPHFSRASSAEMRRGPKPGCASEKATIRCSRCGSISLGSAAWGRSRRFSASRPQRSTCRFNRY